MDQPTVLAETIHRLVLLPQGLTLDCGVHLAPLEIALCSYGTLNRAADNAILVCHALTGDQYAAEPHPVTGKPGWWSRMVGSGLPIDTDRYFVLCMNVLGGCMGSTGPRSPRPGSGDGSTEPHLSMPWGTDFPPITIRDMVRAQRLVIAELGIERLFAVIGGSMGGMQVLQWAATYPQTGIRRGAGRDRRRSTRRRTSPSTRSAGRRSPPIRIGTAAATGRMGVIPARGLAVARMMAHITYLSEEALTRKFGRRLRRDPYNAEAPLALFGEMFEVESYLRHQGSSFVRRFDANSYLTITRAMDYFDIAADHDGDGLRLHSGTPTRASVSSRFPRTGCFRRRSRARWRGR